MLKTGLKTVFAVCLIFGLCFTQAYALLPADMPSNVIGDPPPWELVIELPKEEPHDLMVMTDNGDTLFKVEYSGRIVGEKGREIGKLNERELKLFRQFMNRTYTYSLTDK